MWEWRVVVRGLKCVSFSAAGTSPWVPSNRFPWISSSCTWQAIPSPSSLPWWCVWWPGDPSKHLWPFQPLSRCWRVQVRSFFKVWSISLGTWWVWHWLFTSASPWVCCLHMHQIGWPLLSPLREWSLVEEDYFCEPEKESTMLVDLICILSCWLLNIFT